MVWCATRQVAAPQVLTQKNPVVSWPDDTSNSQHAVERVSAWAFVEYSHSVK
jgi:hypothetical protein